MRRREGRGFKQCFGEQGFGRRAGMRRGNGRGFACGYGRGMNFAGNDECPQTKADWLNTKKQQLQERLNLINQEIEKMA